ncbi:MAG: rod shape-determining protein MreD [Nitrospinae bacterium]|nr:rod shape-determining protein MreD [Nitrospinota bacterium]MBF0633339.1 rod shape-determining protein MreD [Nitrospinota bacterium]
MRLAVYAAALTFAFVAQTTSFHFTRGAVPWPDLALILLVFGGLRLGKMGGVKLGLVTGLAEDMLSYGVLGANTFSKSLIGFGVGKLRDDLVSDSITSRALFTAVATAVDTMAYAKLSQVFTGHAAFPSIVATVVSCAAVNALFALPVMGAMEWAEEKAVSFGDTGPTGRYGSTPSLD